MPLLDIKQINPHTVLGIWQTDETLDSLVNMLPTYVDAAQIEQVHPKRKKEWLASRVLIYKLLEQFTSIPAVLLKNENGKPYFKDQQLHISISHSPYLAAAILSDKYEVGIDIELVSQKALRIADKFLSEAEKEFTAQNEEQTCLYWSAKETLYKLYSRKQLIFKDNLILYPHQAYNMLNGQIKTANFSKLYQIQFDTLQNHVLTFCTDEVQA
jgi:4'-phosphopantetheinyl transferase